MKRTLDWIVGIAAIQLLFDLGAAGILRTFASAQSIVVTNVRIVDGNGGAPVEHGTIVMEGRKTLAVGPASNISIPPGARRIDGGGRTAMPGLADRHVHLTGGWDGISADMLGYHRISTLSVFEAFSWRRFQDLSFSGSPVHRRHNTLVRAD